MDRNTIWKLRLGVIFLLALALGVETALLLAPAPGPQERAGNAARLPEHQAPAPRGDRQIGRAPARPAPVATPPLAVAYGALPRDATSLVAAPPSEPLPVATLGAGGFATEAPALPLPRPSFDLDLPQVTTPLPPRRPRDLLASLEPAVEPPAPALAAVPPPAPSALAPPLETPPPVTPMPQLRGPAGSGAMGSPVFVRIFKRERELELYVRDNGRYVLKKTYPICKMSGRVGPKLKAGDYQAPEGFYVVTQRQLNPNSQYHLAFNVGFPNAFDRQNRRTGSAIMVHGDCVSIGCFAMTDKGIDEIYGYVAAALKGGQREVPVHIFPFRMTNGAMASAGAPVSGGGGGLAALFTPVSSGVSENADFWRELKQGYDIFEKTGQPPSAYACKGRYAFSAGPGCQRIAGW